VLADPHTSEHSAPVSVVLVLMLKFGRACHAVGRDAAGRAAIAAWARLGPLAWRRWLRP